MWVSSRYLLYGFAFALPFLIGNVLIAFWPEFFLSLLRPSEQSVNYEHLVVLIFIALVGVGGIAALLPIFRKKRLYLVNALVGIAFVAFALFGGFPLGYDFYKCDILRIPNCD